VKQQELQLLLFSLGNARYGIDIEQIAALTAANANPSAISLAELLSSIAFADSIYSKQLFIKQNLQTPILINEPDEVASFSIADIRILPDILAISAARKGVWGLLPQGHDIIILLDLYKNQRFQQLTKMSADVNSHKQEGYHAQQS